MSFIKFVILYVSLALILAPLNFVSADAWWGDGYRDEYWVLKHGGTIIKYKIKRKEDSDKYKVRLYLMGRSGAGGDASNAAKKGDVIETETGGSGVIDDAINNTYKLIVFKGDDKKMDTIIVARPGEEVSVKFDLKKDKAETSSIARIPLSQIKLNSQSQKYINPSSLNYTINKEVNKSKEQGNREQELVKETLVKKIEKELELNEKHFEENIQYISEKLGELEEKSDFWYLFQGPEEKNIKSLEKSLESNRNKIMDLRQLAQKAPSNALKEKIIEKISTFQQRNNEVAENINRKKESLSFWKRTSKLFQ